jgi:hypothetical protein
VTDIERLAAGASIMQRDRAMAEEVARAAGKFWLPCPLCGTPFGGHEWTVINGHRKDVPDKWTTDEMGIVEKISGKGICPDCTAQGLGCKRHIEIGFAVHEDCEYMQEYLKTVPWGRSRSERSDPEGEQ